MGVYFGPLEVEFWFLGFDFEHLRGDFGHLGVAFESMGVGSWPLVVNFSSSRCRLFLSLGVDFGFRESILILSGRFWDSQSSDVGDLGAQFGKL